MFSIPRNAKGNYDWNAIADGRYYVEWYIGGTRRREGAGVTAAQALEAQRRKRHELEGRNLGVPGFEKAGETVKKPALQVAVKTYLEQIEALKKPNTHRKTPMPRSKRSSNMRRFALENPGRFRERE